MLLEVKNVVKEYTKGIPVLKKVNIHINFGEIVGIIGLNGAGKSTMMRLITGANTIQKGEILFEGKNINNLSRNEKRNIAYLSAENNLYAELSVTNNLEFFRRFYGATTLDKSEVIDKLYLKDILNKKVETLSSGMRQRVAIASTTMKHSKLLLLDEPTVALDIEAKDKMLNYIKSFSGSDNSIIITSHNIKDIEDLCDRVYILRKGEIIKESTVHGILNEAMNHNQMWTITIKASKDNNLQRYIKDFQNYQEQDYINLFIEENNKKDIINNLTSLGADIVSIKNEVNNLEDAILEIIKEGEDEGCH
jgi:ABC-2 type transport system ATP-binding protein